MSEQPATSSIPDWDLADRMRKGLRKAGVSVQQMADYLGVKRNTVGTWINGRNQPSPQTLRLWAMRCGIDHYWLVHGTVENHVAAASAIADPGLNNAGSTGRIVTLTNFGPSILQAAA
jgi:transcriptional regulator with XRE-family HTH domain